MLTSLVLQNLRTVVSRKLLAWLFVLALLIVGNLFTWYFILAPQTLLLRVSFLDVGQGDAIFIEGPTGIQMLIDGGRDRSVLRKLGGVMSPFDRSIDLVVETHPDADHITGLSGVFKNYRVQRFMSPGIPNDTSATEALEAAVANEKGVTSTLARRGERITLGGGAYAEVIYPDRDVSGVETNTGSVVLQIHYGATSFMLTGDLPSAVEDYLVALDGSALKSDVLKAGHHGSRTSTDDLWLATVHPNAVVISAGKDNSYGHPHEETLARIRNEGAAILSTIEKGTVGFVSDGTVVTIK
jgi:competence protein ComEC